MTPTTHHRTHRRLVALALAGAGATAALAVPTAIPAHAAPAPVAAPAASTTTYTAPASASWDYTARGVHATITVTRQGDTLYRVQISGTTQGAQPTTIPATFSSGVMAATGTYPMRSGHGTMALTSTSATFAFNRAYLNGYRAPFTFSGEWLAVVTSAQTSTQTITVGGHSYAIGVHAPATSGQADGAGQRIMERHSYEVDRAELRSAKVAGLYFGADNDGGLGFGELRRLYQDPSLKHDFAEQFRFVTVTIPKDATVAERNAAINHALPRGWDGIATTARQTPTAHTPIEVTTAWEVQTSKGAKPAPGGAAWGPRHNVPELYAGSSEQEHLA